MTKAGLWCVLVLAAGAAVHAAVFADYDFNEEGNLASAVPGAPAVVVRGAAGLHSWEDDSVFGTQRKVLSIKDGGGLAVKVPAMESYTISMVVKLGKTDFDSPGGKLVDYDNATTVSGLYVTKGKLSLVPLPSALVPGGAVVADSWVHVIITRRNDTTVSCAVDGEDYVSVDDTAGFFVPTENQLLFFSGGPEGNNTSGSVARIRVWGSSMSEKDLMDVGPLDENPSEDKDGGVQPPVEPPKDEKNQKNQKDADGSDKKDEKDSKDEKDNKDEKDSKDEKDEDEDEESRTDPVWEWEGHLSGSKVEEKAAATIDKHVWLQTKDGNKTVGFTITAKVLPSKGPNWQDIAVLGGCGGFLFGIHKDKWILAKQCASGNRETGGPVEPGKAVYITATYDNSTAQFFVNGDLVVAKPLANVLYTNKHDKIFIGGDPVGGNEHESFKGAIAFVGIWKGVLSAEEIMATVTTRELADGGNDKMGKIESIHIAHENKDKSEDDAGTEQKDEDEDVEKADASSDNIPSPELTNSQMVKPGGCLAQEGSAVPANMWGGLFTLAARVKVAKQEDWQAILARADCGGVVFGLKDMQWRFGQQCHAETVKPFEKSPQAIDGETYNVAVTYDGKRSILYVNGAKVDENEVHIEFSNADSLFLGCSNPESFAQKWRGFICTVEVFQAVLTEGEVVRLSHRMTKDGACPHQPALAW